MPILHPDEKRAEQRLLPLQLFPLGHPELLHVLVDVVVAAQDEEGPPPRDGQGVGHALGQRRTLTPGEGVLRKVMRGFNFVY